MTSHLPRLSLLFFAVAVLSSGATPSFEITQRETQEIALVPGMTATELITQLGEPNEIAPYASTSSSAEHWTYRHELTHETATPGLQPSAPSEPQAIRVQVIELMMFNGVLIAGKHFIEIRDHVEP